MWQVTRSISLLSNSTLYYDPWILSIFNSQLSATVRHLSTLVCFRSTFQSIERQLETCLHHSSFLYVILVVSSWPRTSFKNSFHCVRFSALLKDLWITRTSTAFCIWSDCFIGDLPRVSLDHLRLILLASPSCHIPVTSSEDIYCSFSTDVRWPVSDS